MMICCLELKTNFYSSDLNTNELFVKFSNHQDKLELNPMEKHGKMINYFKWNIIIMDENGTYLMGSWFSLQLIKCK